MKILIISILCLFIFDHVKSQGCGNCFPGTSSSLCPYRKSTDPIICGSDGKKYTPCTYNCVKTCNPGLSIAGCGSNCVTTYGTSCPPPATEITTTTTTTTTLRPITTPTTTITSPTKPSETTTSTTKTTDTTITTTTTISEPECKKPNDPECQFLSKPDNSCQVSTMEEQCKYCLPDSPAKGQCNDVEFCYITENEDTICSLSFDPSECDMDPKSVACTTCPPNSPAKGKCFT